MSFKPGGIFCPRCAQTIEPAQDTARHLGRLWHAGCLEDHLMDRLEEAVMQARPAPC